MPSVSMVVLSKSLSLRAVSIEGVVGDRVAVSFSLHPYAVKSIGGLKLSESFSVKSLSAKGVGGVKVSGAFAIAEGGYMIGERDIPKVLDDSDIIRIK